MNDVDARVDLSGFSAEYLGGASAALAQVELRIGAGESVLITGPSGSGKSTLALCLTGFIPNAVYARLSGGIRVCGVEPAAQGVYDMARRVGLVQQDAEGQFCTMRVEDEAAFGPENLMCSEAEIERRVSGALELAGAAHLAGRALAELSGGEKQRVAIASVLAMQPQLLVLDEPAAHLDPRATRSVADSLRAIQRDSGLSIVILEHKPWRFA
ncbi:MAG TPA: heme ABC transporter ATP-binding protein, partial [Firmicutes bacterium]|nr:heme ABC transporter ATP-binding protein [Bacillota bacterium]